MQGMFGPYTQISDSTMHGDCNAYSKSTVLPEQSVWVVCEASHHIIGYWLEHFYSFCLLLRFSSAVMQIRPSVKRSWLGLASYIVTRSTTRFV